MKPNAIVLADITSTDIATTSVQTPSTSLTTSAMTTAQHNTLSLTVTQSEEFTSKITVIWNDVTTLP